MYSKRRTRSSKYSRRTFDPQHMYQHPVTRRQAKGLVLQPKLPNLDPPEPRMTKQLLEHYYETVKSYGMISNDPVKFVETTIEIQPGANVIELNKALMEQLLTQEGIDPSQLREYQINSMTLRKDPTQNWPYNESGYSTKIEYHVGTINQSKPITAGSDISAGSTVMVDIATIDYLGQDETNIHLGVPSVKVSSDYSKAVNFSLDNTYPVNSYQTEARLFRTNPFIPFAASYKTMGYFDYYTTKVTIYNRNQTSMALTVLIIYG